MTNLLRGYTETFDGCGAFNESQLLRQTVPTREACQIQRRKKFRRRTTTTKKKTGGRKNTSGSSISWGGAWCFAGFGFTA